MKVRSLDILVLDEISLVDRPANPGARVALWKRDPGTGDDAVTLEEIKKQLEDSQKEITELKAKLEKSQAAETSLTSVLEKLAKAGEAPVIVKVDGEKVEVTEAKIDKTFKSDAIVEIDGVKFSKSEVNADVLTLLEKQSESIRIQREKASQEAIEKRAEDTFPDLSGSARSKAVILKAIDDIKDEEVRKEALESLKAANAAVKAAFQSVGSNPSDDQNSATAKLDKAVHKRMDEKGETFAVAFDEVIKTAEGRKLRFESDKERRETR